MGQPQNFDYRDLIYRVGTFFLLIGIGLVVIFILSEGAGQASLEYFCTATVFLVIGFMFRAQYKRSIQPSGRFRILKMFRPKSKEDKGKKKE
jgi:positive regulator of sigma E activity